MTLVPQIVLLLLQDEADAGSVNPLTVDQTDITVDQTDITVDQTLE